MATLRHAEASARTRSTRRGRAGLAMAVGFPAAMAWWGTIGLVSGTMSIGHALEQRLPLHSPVLGGIALGLVVALPATVTAVLAARGSVLADPAARVLGLVMVAWIVVELSVLRELNFLHPLVAGYGLALAVGKRRARWPVAK